jgi:mRNA (guanine-N7-)-methyltransferase
LRPNGHFSNQVCSVSVTGDWLEASKSEPPQPVPLFGAEIQFQLEGVVNCPEYLCYFPLLKKYFLI